MNKSRWAWMILLLRHCQDGIFLYPSKVKFSKIQIYTGMLYDNHCENFVTDVSYMSHGIYTSTII